MYIIPKLTGINIINNPIKESYKLKTSPNIVVKNVIPVPTIPSFTPDP